jgi:hypothetical protein
MGSADPFDPDRLRLAGDRGGARARPPHRPPRHRPGEKFLRGPVPWGWLDRAGRLPGKALAVALVLWKEAGCLNRREVRLCLNGPLPLGLNRQSARRGLRRLIAAGLVEARHRPGRGLDVTLMDAQGGTGPCGTPTPPGRSEARNGSL